MNKLYAQLYWRHACLLLVALVFIPLQVADAIPGNISKKDAYRMLQVGHSEAVRRLPKGDREILLATFAMNAGQTQQALKYLNSDPVRQNRLAALIKAEAYRLQSVRAADRAGHYAHAVNGDIGTLKKARITTGLDEANLRLDAFLRHLNQAKPDLKKSYVLKKPQPVATFPVIASTAYKQVVVVEAFEPEVVTLSKATPSALFPPVVVPPRVSPTVSPRVSPTVSPSMSPTVSRVVEKTAVQPKKPTPVRAVSRTQPASQPVGTQQVKKQPIASVPKSLKVKAKMPEKAVVGLKLAKLQSHQRNTSKQQLVKSPVSPPVHDQQRSLASVHQAIEAWRRDWSSLDNQAYLSHYDKSFKTLKYNYASWARYKRRVNGKKSYIKVSVSDVKIIPSSGKADQGEAVLVTFNQRYRSSNYNAVGRKQLYMARKDTKSPWLILYEGDGS